MLVGTYFSYKIRTTDIDFILFFSTAGTPEENLEAAAALFSLRDIKILQNMQKIFLKF